MNRLITFVTHQYDRAGNLKWVCHLQCSHQVEVMGRKAGRKGEPLPRPEGRLWCPVCERMVREEEEARRPAAVARPSGRLPDVRRRYR